MRIWLTLGLCIHLVTNIQAQGAAFDPERKYHPDSLKRWTTGLMEEMREKHPGFYRYTSKERFGFLVDSTQQTIRDSLTELQYYRKIKPLFARIGCLHTGISLSPEYQDYLDRSLTFIPFDIFIDPEKRVFIAKNYAPDQDILVGKEIISINGEPIMGIINRLLQAIPSDGYNQTEKILLLNHRFASWYQTIISASRHFTVEIKEDENHRMYELKGVSKDAFSGLELLQNNYRKALEFDVVNGTGVLKIHSFARSDIRATQQNFKKFTRQVFRRIKQEAIRDLIIDVRYNTGGTDGNAAFLSAYFFDRPFRYWEKIEVTEAIAKEIKGMNRLFYKKPVKADTSYHWQKSWITNEFDYYQPRKPAKNHFTGRTYIITNGLCLSSCSDFIAILSNSNKAIVVGQETGGGFQGNTSGMIPETKIPAGLIVTIPLQKYTNAVDLTKNFGHGTMPDYEITPTFNDWISGRDIEMEFLWELIRKE